MKLDKNYKVRVTPKQSRQIQELAIKLGFEWWTSGKQVVHTEVNNLTLGTNCMIFGCFANHREFDADTRFTEISADDLITLLADLPKSAENPLQGAELTPEFKAGDPVYCFGEKRISKINEYVGDETYSLRDSETLYQADYLTLATQENYERLQAAFPDIEFEAPPKELTGSDLAMALIKKGWVGFNCLCGNSGDENAITETIVTGVNNSGQFTTIDGKLFNNAIPVIGLRALEAREVGL